MPARNTFQMIGQYSRRGLRFESVDHRLFTLDRYRSKSAAPSDSVRKMIRRSVRSGRLPVDLRSQAICLPGVVRGQRKSPNRDVFRILVASSVASSRTRTFGRTMPIFGGHLIAKTCNPLHQIAAAAWDQPAATGLIRLPPLTDQRVKKSSTRFCAGAASGGFFFTSLQFDRFVKFFVYRCDPTWWR